MIEYTNFKPKWMKDKSICKDSPIYRYPEGIEWLTSFKRCDRTNNPCGADTYQIEDGCQCNNCKESRTVEMKEQEIPPYFITEESFLSRSLEDREKLLDSMADDQLNDFGYHHPTAVYFLDKYRPNWVKLFFDKHPNWT